MATTEAKPGTPMLLTDLPGIGASKAQWLSDAGVRSVEELRNASVDQIAHVRGIGYVLANRLKELVAAPADAEPLSAAEQSATEPPAAEQLEAEPPATEQLEAEPPATEQLEAEARWRARLVDVQASIRDEIEGLLASPAERALSPKFVRQLCRVRVLVEVPPPEDHPVAPKNQRRIMKHTRAIRALVGSAAKMDTDSREHQKVLGKQLRSRYRKLAKWV